MPIFGNCKDLSLIALKKVGYNVVQLPRVDLLPTQLLVAGDKKLQRLGDLTSVFVPNVAGAPVPPIMPDQPGPNFCSDFICLNLSIARSLRRKGGWLFSTLLLAHRPISCLSRLPRSSSVT